MIWVKTHPIIEIPLQKSVVTFSVSYGKSCAEQRTPKKASTNRTVIHLNVASEKCFTLTPRPSPPKAFHSKKAKKRQDFYTHIIFQMCTCFLTHTL